MKKQLLFALLTIGFAGSLQAQDILYKTNGRQESAKITEVNSKTIKYKKWDNANGPDYVLPIKDIQKVKYQNGQEEVFNDSKGLKKGKSSLSDPGAPGKNIIAFSPIWMTNTSAVGIGMSYERMLDKNSVFSFILPVAYSFNSPTNNFSSSENRRSNMLWAYPGVKVYVGSKNEGKVRYAIGLSIPVGNGAIKEDRMIYDPLTQTNMYQTLESKISLVGVMLNNSVNFQLNSAFYLGIEFGLGVPYFIDINSNPNLPNNPIYTPYDNSSPLVNFNFKFGYRF